MSRQKIIQPTTDNQFFACRHTCPHDFESSQRGSRPEELARCSIFYGRTVLRHAQAYTVHPECSPACPAHSLVCQPCDCPRERGSGDPADDEYDSEEGSSSNDAEKGRGGRQLAKAGRPLTHTEWITWGRVLFDCNKDNRRPVLMPEYYADFFSKRVSEPPPPPLAHSYPLATVPINRPGAFASKGVSAKKSRREAQYSKRNTNTNSGVYRSVRSREDTRGNEPRYRNYRTEPGGRVGGIHVERADSQELDDDQPLQDIRTERGGHPTTSQVRSQNALGSSEFCPSDESPRRNVRGSTINSRKTGQGSQKNDRTTRSQNITEGRKDDIEHVAGPSREHHPHAGQNAQMPQTIQLGGAPGAASSQKDQVAPTALPPAISALFPGLLTTSQGLGSIHFSLTGEVKSDPGGGGISGPSDMDISLHMNYRVSHPSSRIGSQPQSSGEQVPVAPPASAVCDPNPRSEKEEIGKAKRKRQDRSNEVREQDEEQSEPRVRKQRRYSRESHDKGTAENATTVNDNAIIQRRQEEVLGHTPTDAGCPSHRVENPRKPVKLMTSQIAFPSTDAEALQMLGVEVTRDPAQCTHIVVPCLIRTEKFLCALAAAPYVLSEAWSKDSIAKGSLQNENDYLLHDSPGETKYGMKLEDTFQRAKEFNGRLFWNKTFIVTPKVPFDSKLEKVVSTYGGRLVAYRGFYLQALRADMVNTSVISCPEDEVIWRPIVQEGFRVYSLTFIYASIMRQRTDWDDQSLMVMGR